MFAECTLGTSTFSQEATKQVGWVTDMKSLAQSHAELARRLQISFMEGKSLFFDESSNVKKSTAKENPNLTLKLKEELAEMRALLVRN